MVILYQTKPLRSGSRMPKVRSPARLRRLPLVGKMCPLAPTFVPHTSRIEVPPLQGTAEIQDENADPWERAHKMVQNTISGSFLLRMHA